MKKFFRISIALLLAIVINMFIPFADSVNAVAEEVDISKYGIDPNILTAYHLMFGYDGSGAGIVDQYWYTKLIKLDGYNKKDVSGTLHYEIVPDYSIDNAKPIEYQVSGKFPRSKVFVTVRRGRLSKYEYDVPFSSNDFVDPKFNELCANASTDFGLNYGFSWSNEPKEYGNANAKNYVELFNHAFLHEWGTIITREKQEYYDNGQNDDQKIYRVGNFSQSHFSSLQNYLEYLKQMRNNNLLINWQGDPETFVTGYRSDWQKTEFPVDEANIDRRLRSSTADEKLLVDASKNEEHLSAYPSFRDGSMKFTSFHTIPEYFKDGPYGNDLNDRLYTITRPIAISKKYDSNGNITLLEKPLFPSVSMAKFLYDNAYYYKQDHKDDHTSRLEIYRYILREKQPTGVTLKCDYEPYILDVVYPTIYSGGGKIYIYKHGEEPDYKNYFRTSPDIKSSIDYGPFANEVSKRLQVENTFSESEPEPEPTPSPTPVPTETHEPGNGGRDLLSWNISFGPAGGGLGFVDQTWYTKLIDLQGYQGKDIEGTLHFELVPDTSAHDEYTVKAKTFDEQHPDDPNNYSKVKVVPGIMTFKYDIPFSSDDFVDEEFNRLTRNAKTDFTYSWSGDKAPTGEKVRAEHILKLFSHAFMHEWGTVVTSDHSSVYRVGKVTPSDFQSKEDFDVYDKKMKSSNQWVNWENDPEKQVTGYKTYTDDFDLKNEAQYNRSPIKLNEHVYKHLAEIPEFVGGTMDFRAKFIPPYSQVSYTLYTITRNIAVSKTYDAAGNITSIEKPLLPSVPLLNFYAQHNEKVFPEDDASKSPYKDIDDCDYVFRYILKEKAATGIDITPMDANIVVEVAYQRGYGYHSPTIRMFRDETKATSNRYTYRTNKDYILKPFANETTDRLQVGNYLRVKATPTPVVTPSPNGYPQTGDNSNVWLYIALIGVALITTLIIIRKRKAN